jgi:hypothetical protein
VRKCRGGYKTESHMSYNVLLTCNCKYITDFVADGSVFVCLSVCLFVCCCCCCHHHYSHLLENSLLLYYRFNLKFVWYNCKIFLMSHDYNCWLQTIFHTQFVGMFITYFHTKFQIHKSTCSLVSYFFQTES